MAGAGDSAGDPFGGVFAGRRVLLTGHSGFKGSWLTLWLDRLGAQVRGVSLAPATDPTLYDLSVAAVTAASPISTTPSPWPKKSPVSTPS